MTAEQKKWKKSFYKSTARYAMTKLGLTKFISKKFFTRPVLDIDSANECIRNRFEEGKPFMVCRFGETELRAVVDALGIKLGAKKKPDPERLKRLYNNAGVFPHGAEMEMKFAELMCDLIPIADIIGVWNTFMQDYVVDNYVRPDALLVGLRGLEPYYCEKPWSAGLKGKKVLVIHPFVDTIRKQYEKREKLFDNRDILPKFELKTLRAVQTIAGQKDERFKDWFEALEYMYEEAMKIDFDVAIIGCGAYGFPLAAKLKKAGKQAVHLGGATQILFGIKGARWDNHPFISKLYNEYWVRPSKSERPGGSGSVENGCYW